MMPAPRQQVRFIPYAPRQGVNRGTFDQGITEDTAIETGWSGARLYPSQQQHPPQGIGLNRPLGRPGIAIPSPLGGRN